MTRRQMADDVRTQCGNLIPLGRLSEYLGLDPKTTKKWLADTPYIRLGNKRCYMAADIARKLEACQVVPKK